MKRMFCVMIVCFILLFTAACAPKAAEDSGDLLPDILSEKSFIYDELENGTGDSLYTLSFTRRGYKLYLDGGEGIISRGDVKLGSDRTITFGSGEESFQGSYTGSSFEEPSVKITFDGKEMTFTPDTDSGEYVYLSYLGTYEGKIGNSPAILILDRWHEYYVYAKGRLTRGTYEIYSDGTLEFVNGEGYIYEGAAERTEEEFDVRDITLSVNVKGDGINAKNAEFVYAEPDRQYTAQHAMGEYTLRVYNDEVYTIYGVDGFLKSMGNITFDDDGGSISYFPRCITNEYEKDRITEFSATADGYAFPGDTLLLPRSGNMDPESGYATYWSAGTTLDFIQYSEEGYVWDVVWDEKDLTDDNLPDADSFLDNTMPTLNKARPLVLLVDFPDYHRPRFVTKEGIYEAMFSLENKDSLSSFYYRSSYGNLVIDGEVLDWYRTEKNRDMYDSDKEIMKEVLNYYINEKGLDITDYDADGNGIVDSVYLLWAGNMSSDGDSHMWTSAYRSTWYNSPSQWDAKVTGYIFVPGSTVWSGAPPLVCNVNSLTHETGHLLGLNDYYSYDTSPRTRNGLAYSGGALDGGLGGMDMMDANIADHNVFSKWLLGWVEPTVIEYDGISSLDGREYTLRPSNEHGDALFIKLRDSKDMYTEMLVIEAVSSTMNANELTRLTQPKVRILHVDASVNDDRYNGNWRAYGFKYDNSYTTTKFIGVVEADGKDDVLNHHTAEKLSYDPEDYFSAGDVISPSTYPNTNGYDRYGNATVYNGLRIDILSIGDDGSARIKLSYEDKPVTLSVTDISPSAAVVPYEENSVKTIPSSTKEIKLTYERNIRVDEAKIKIYSSMREITAYTVSAEKNILKITFDEALSPNSGYQLVVKQGAVTSEDGSVHNNYNSIFGFVTEK